MRLASYPRLGIIAGRLDKNGPIGRRPRCYPPILEMALKQKHEWKMESADCEVIDQVKLVQFRAKAEVWIDALEGDDQNSVTSQLNDMMWTDAAWRSLNEMRRMAVGQEDFGTPGMMAALLDQGYISGQVISIARLIEPAANRPTRQVNSIRRLVDEISDNRNLFTREIYICRDGLPYDYEALRAVENQSIASLRAKWVPTSGSLAWHQSKLLHEEFDRLSGVAPEMRTRNDTIADALLDRMIAAFDEQVFKDILELRHKSVAHAADAFSRSTAKSLRSGISLNEFARAHFILLGLYQAISANLLYQSWRASAVPNPQYDQFVGFDKPLVKSDNMNELHHFWDKHTEERDGWLHQAYREFIPC